MSLGNPGILTFVDDHPLEPGAHDPIAARMTPRRAAALADEMLDNPRRRPPDFRERDVLPPENSRGSRLKTAWRAACSVGSYGGASTSIDVQKETVPRVVNVLDFQRFSAV